MIRHGWRSPAIVFHKQAMMEQQKACGTPAPGMPTAQASLREMALVFLKLGTIAFGGPAAHIALMEDEFVTRRRWLTREQFLDRLGAANLIPGPSSTEMAIFIGYEKRGWPGLLVAGCSFTSRPPFWSARSLLPTLGTALSPR